MSGESTKTTQTDNSGHSYYDSWVTDSGKNLFDTANGTQGYQAYTGPTQGAFGDTWTQAGNWLSSQLGKTNPDTTAASGGFQSILNSLDPSKSTTDYMNPYTAATLQPTLNNINQSFDQARQGTGASATMAGDYGGSAQGVEQALNEKNRATAIGDATNQAYSTAFTNAQQQQSNALNQIMQASGGLNSVGQSAFGQGTTLSSLLAGLGAQQQQANQTGISTGINLNELTNNGQMGQYQKLAQILAMLPKNQNTMSDGTSTTTAPDNSWMALLGSGLGGGGGGGGLSSLLAL